MQQPLVCVHFIKKKSTGKMTTRNAAVVTRKLVEARSTFNLYRRAAKIALMAVGQHERMMIVWRSTGFGTMAMYAGRS